LQSSFFSDWGCVVSFMNSYVLGDKAKGVFMIPGEPFKGALSGSIYGKLSSSNYNLNSNLL
jgi:hypothetical protein